MRLVDTIVRRGHLSDRALVDAWQNGARPAHLDRCDLCLDRTVALTRWLDDIGHAAIDEADAAFPVEKLAAQHQQILRRLEQLERPAKLITFPGASRPAHADGAIAAHWRGWVAAAMAAGVLVGIFGDRVTVQLTQHAKQAAVTAKLKQQPADVQATIQRALTDEEWAELNDAVDRSTPTPLAAIEDLTPHIAMVTTGSRR